MDRITIFLLIFGQIWQNCEGLKHVIVKETDLQGVEIPMKTCREAEILEKCKNYNYAVVKQKNGGISCLNEFQETHLTLSVSSEIERICDNEYLGTAFGAFNAAGAQSVSTLYFIQEHEIHQTHDYFGCVSNDIIMDETVIGQISH